MSNMFPINQNILPILPIFSEAQFNSIHEPKLIYRRTHIHVLYFGIQLL